MDNSRQSVNDRPPPCPRGHRRASQRRNSNRPSRLRPRRRTPSVTTRGAFLLVKHGVHDDVGARQRRDHPLQDPQPALRAGRLGWGVVFGSVAPSTGTSPAWSSRRPSSQVPAVAATAAPLMMSLSARFLACPCWAARCWGGWHQDGIAGDHRQDPGSLQRRPALPSGPGHPARSPRSLTRPSAALRPTAPHQRPAEPAG